MDINFDLLDEHTCEEILDPYLAKSTEFYENLLNKMDELGIKTLKLKQHGAPFDIETTTFYPNCGGSYDYLKLTDDGYSFGFPEAKGSSYIYGDFSCPLDAPSIDDRVAMDSWIFNKGGIDAIKDLFLNRIAQYKDLTKDLEKHQI